MQKIIYKLLSGCDLKESKRCHEAEGQSEGATQVGLKQTVSQDYLTLINFGPQCPRHQ